jgi:hypothetical protein
MANVKITDLTELAAVDLATNDVLPIVDINNDSTKKVTIASLTGLSDANDFITFTRLQANIDVVQDNVASVTVGTAADTETRLNANLNVLDSNADAIETRRVANVTIQTAIEARRVANIAGAVSTITTADLTASRALASDSSGKVAVATTTLAELNHVSGVSGAVQTQLDAKAALAGATFTGDVTLTNTDGGASASPIIVLDRQSASPADADYLGRIQFKGKDDGAGNDTYAQISGKIIDASAGSEDGAIEVSIKKAGSSTIVSRQKSDKLQLLNGTQLSVDGTSEFTGEVTMTDDLVVTGNLTVNGATTTVSTTNLDVEDRMIMLADGVSGSPSADVGLLFNRGNQGNAAIFYDESAKTFKLSDTKDPKSNTSLSPVTASNLSVGIVDAATLKYDGLSVHTSIADNASVAAAASAAVEARRVANIAGAVSTITTGNLTASRALASDSSGKVAVSAVTATELGYVAGVTGAIQTQLDAKGTTTEDTALQARLTANVAITTAVEARRVANIAGAISTVLTGDLTADRVMITNGSGKIAASSGVTPTELGYLDGLTLGTVAASKAVTADSNGDVNFVREVDIDGNVVIGTNASNTVTIVGVLDCGAFS